MNYYLLCKINYNCNESKSPFIYYSVPLLCKNNYNCNSEDKKLLEDIVPLLCKNNYNCNLLVTNGLQTFVLLLCKTNYNCNLGGVLRCVAVYHYPVKSITIVTFNKVIEIGFCDFSFNLRFTLNYLMSTIIRSN